MRFAVEAIPVRDLGLREASDQRIFDAARAAGAVVMTKDVDFVAILERLGPAAAGAVDNLREHLGRTASGDIQGCVWSALEMLAAGEPLVEVR